MSARCSSGVNCEHVAHQQVRLIARVALEARRERAGEYPAIAVALEQAGRHGRARERLTPDW